MADPVFHQTSRRTGKTAEARTKLYRAVHAACRANGIDEDERRDMQNELFGKASLSDMTVSEITRLLDSLNRNRKVPGGHRAHVSKVRALWWSLYWLGEVDQSEDRAISAFVKRQTGVNALRWLDHRSAPSVIEALKAWLERAGVEWPTAEQTASLQVRRPTFTATQHERTAVVHAQKTVIARRGHGFPGHYVTEFMAGLDRLQTGTFSIFDLEVPELDGLIRHLGLVIRKGKA